MPKIIEQAAVVEHRQVTTDVMDLLLYAPQIARQSAAGQFVHLGTEALGGGLLLRRPVSIADVDHEKGTVRLLYRVVGKGTAALAKVKPAERIDLLGSLGNGFDLACERPLLVGGGMGIAPLIYLSRQFKVADLLIGGRNSAEMFWPEYFENSARQLHVTTDDGSMGVKGFVVALLPKLLEKGNYDRVFVCGPQVMMESVAACAKRFGVPCQVSLEKHMACGIGACLSCTCENKSGGKRKKVCTDGPVFWAEEVLG